MSATKPASVEEYVAAVPAERREAFDSVLRLVRESLPEGYEEALSWGMVCWQVPLEVYPDTYNRKPLMFCALANHKSYLSLYLVPAYVLPGALEKLQASGRTLRMGKSCINFTAAEELPLAEIGEIIRDTDVPRFVATAKAAARER
jgi:hypothetical protein